MVNKYRNFFIKFNKIRRFYDNNNDFILSVEIKSGFWS